MNSKERLLKYLDFKGIKKAEFYKKTGLSNGFLDKNANISSDKIEIISNIFSDLNLIWLIKGESDMLANDSAVDISALNSSEFIQSQQETIRSQQRTVEELTGIIKNLTNKQ